MAEAAPIHPIALVVEDDEMQRSLVSMLLEESDMTVVECESAEAAVAALEHIGATLALVFTDVRLAGDMDGFALARIAARRCPHAKVIVTSGADGPDGRMPRSAVFIQKPWRALDILRAAEHSVAIRH
ncbi:MAG: response regulator [Pseudorhodoplanes sp.]